MRVLLETRNDYLPGPKALELPSSPGVAEGRRVPCECRTGRIQRGAQVRLCLVCNGSAWRNRRGGEPAWDEYIGARVAGEETKRPRTMTPQELDGELTRLRRDASAREGRVAADDLTAVERGRKARDGSGSYVELERSLERMHQYAYGARQLIDLHYGAGIALDDASRARLDQAIAWLAVDMRGPVRIPPWAWEQETEKLLDEVQRLGREGHQVSEIAEELQMSQRRVKTLLGRRKA